MPYHPRIQIPPSGNQTFSNVRCLKLLEMESHRPLVALMAPTGYGKTTLLAARAAALAAGTPVAWLTLDAEDDDIGSLLALFAVMLTNVSGRKRGSAKPQSYPTVESLLSALCALDEIHLFFDRYEVLRSDDAHRLFERLIVGSSGRAHFYIASREKLLPFASDVRHLHPLTLTHEQLRWSPTEIQLFLRHRIRRDPDSTVLVMLDRATEGWPRAVDAYASLVDGNDAQPLGDDEAVDRIVSRMHHVFLDDLWSNETDISRLFLLRLSIPDDFDEELCRILTEVEDSHDRLERQLDQIPLLFQDANVRRRYHPLLARWLRERFRQQDKNDYISVQRRVIAWFEQEGRALDAVRHALDIADYQRAAELLLADISVTFSAPRQTVLHRLELFPVTELYSRPAIAMLYAWLLAAEHRIVAAETALDQTEALMTERSYLFPPTGEDLRGYFASIRSRICFLRRDSERGMAYMKETEARLHGPGKLYSHYNTIDPFGSSLLKSDAGHWGAIDQTAGMCEYAKPRWNSVNQGYGIILILLGECAYERDRLDEAEKLLKEGRRIGIDLADTGLLFPATLTLVQLKLSRGETRAAQMLHQETEKLFAGRFGEDGRTLLDACQARLHMYANRKDDVKAWLRRRPPASERVPELRSMYEYITQLRALVFLRLIGRGISYGEMLLHTCESWILHYHIAEISLQLAVLYEADGEKSTAMRMLENALRIGHQEGYVQLFLTDWGAVKPLIAQYMKQLRAKPSPAARQVVDYCIMLTQSADEREKEADPMWAARKQLTPKEYEVLQALISGLSNVDIAERLSIQVETVKTHCKSIYKKLHLRSRKDAIRSFSEL